MQNRNDRKEIVRWAILGRRQTAGVAKVRSQNAKVK